MIIDKDLLFSEAQAITATATSTNYADLGAGGSGKSHMELAVLVTTAGTGSGTVTASLQECDTATGTYADVVASKAYTGSDLAVGTNMLPIAIPKGTKRYLKVKYTVTGTATVSVTAFIPADTSL